MHWAMDRRLIAPRPDLRALCDLEGRELLLPTEPRVSV
jgi:hypothetical protein